MARKKPSNSDFISFDVIYEDGTRSSNRRIAASELNELDGDDHWLWAGNQRCILEEIAAFVRRLEEGRRLPAD